MQRCSRCVDAGHLPRAAPRCSGPLEARILIVGQAPAERAIDDPTPYGGQSGRWLTQWLAEAGFPADRWRDYVYCTSITRCFPGKARSGQGDRVPSRAEQQLCRPFLDEEIALIDPPIVLLLGQLAIRAFLGEVKLDDVVGTQVEREGRRWIPLPHPSGVSRWLNQPENREKVRQSMHVLRGWIAELGILDRATSAASERRAASGH